MVQYGNYNSSKQSLLFVKHKTLKQSSRRFLDRWMNLYSVCDSCGVRFQVGGGRKLRNKTFLNGEYADDFSDW